MGIKGLMKLIGDEAPSCIKEGEMKNYFGRKIAVDASMCLYQFLIAVRQDGAQLTNEAGEITSHLSGMFYRTVRMIENGLKPVYVFDGKPPEMKSHELKKRAVGREKAKEELEEAKETGTAQEIDKQERRLVKVTKDHVRDAKKVLELLGVPYVEALCEAEAQCAQMCIEGQVNSIATEDMDSLCFKTPVLLRRLTMPESRKLPVQELHFEKLMTVLGLSHAQFVDLCILMGCDYVPNIKGIGPKKAFELIKKHENIETILENIDTKKYTPVENWQYKDARRLFVEPEVYKNMDPPKWKSADVEGMIEFMCGQNGFNEDRIRSGLKRLDKSKGKINQGRMDDFFKVAKVVSTSKPTPKKDTKRKAGKQKGTPAKKTKR